MPQSKGWSEVARLPCISARACIKIFEIKNLVAFLRNFKESRPTLNLGYGIQIMTLFIKSYVQNVTSAKAILDEDPEARKLVDRWHFDAETWEEQLRRPKQDTQPAPQATTLRWTQK